MIKLFKLGVALLLINQLASQAQTIPSPKEYFGFNIGDDYQLSNYTQTEAYFKNWLPLIGLS